MLRRFPRLSLRLSLLALLLPLLARAQTPREGMDALDAEYRKHRQQLPQLFKGSVEADPNNKDHAAAIDAAARYATTRFLWGLYQTEPGKVDRVYQDFDKDVVSIIRGRPNTNSVAQMFTHQVIVHAKEVLALPDRDARPIAKVNVARVLARLWELEQGELADALVEIVKDPKLNNAVKYYAFRGLYELLKLPVPAPPGPPVVAKAQEVRAVAALVEFVQRKVPFTQGTPRQEVDGYRVVRREAIRALAQAHDPVVGTARPALVLLRVVGGDEGVVPEPRLDERLEAAIGVARMRSAGAKDYQPDYAAWVLGRFVVDFVNAANGNFKEGKAALRSRPWRIDAARLGEALEALKADTKDKYVQDVVSQALPRLAEVEGGKQSDPTALNTWLAGNEPPHKELFKDVPESAIKSAAGE
jgi:hypothetical protein